MEVNKVEMLLINVMFHLQYMKKLIFIVVKKN